MRTHQNTQDKEYLRQSCQYTTVTRSVSSPNHRRGARRPSRTLDTNDLGLVRVVRDRVWSVSLGVAPVHVALLVLEVKIALHDMPVVPEVDLVLEEYTAVAHPVTRDPDVPDVLRRVVPFLVVPLHGPIDINPVRRKLSE